MIFTLNRGGCIQENPCCSIRLMLGDGRYGYGFILSKFADMCHYSVVVITCASHAQGPQFNPGW